MERISTYISKLAISLLAMASALSCNVHEWPEIEPAVPVPFSVLFDVDRTITDYEYERVTLSGTSPYSTYHTTTHDMRYVVNVYNYPGTGELDRTVVARYVFTKDDVDDPDHIAEMQLIPGKYRIMVWCDYILQGSTEPLFYNADDFVSIMLREGPHSGCNEARDAYVGQVDFEIVNPDRVNTEEYAANGGIIKEDGTVDVERINDIAVTLKRPMAKYQFISTGLERFIERMQKREYDKMVARGDKVDDASRIVIDLDDYVVKMYYAGFMPEEFNMYMDWVAWSRLGANYESKLTRLSNDEALLAFDYVFVNGGEEVDIKISIEIFDKEGVSVASLAKYPTPLMRNKLTTIRDEFLLSKAEGSIGISPGFDDEFIVPID